MTANPQQLTEATSPIIITSDIAPIIEKEKAECQFNMAAFRKQTPKETPKLSPPIELTHLNDIENPQYVGNPVKVSAIISSNSISYQVPAEISADIEIKTKVFDDTEIPEIYHTSKNIEITDPFNLSLIDTSIEVKERRLKRLFTNGKPTNLKIEKPRTIYLIRVRPPVQTIKQEGIKEIDEQGREYKHYDIYIITDKPLSFQSATKIELTGIPSPNPKTQRITVLAYDVAFPEDTEHFNVEALNQLKNRFNGLSTTERFKWILDNAERYTRIIGRRNVATATYLSYFSPLRAEIYGDAQHGWVLTDIIGDSTTGKSETVKKIAISLNAGMVISAETASIAGILGTVAQMDNGQWFVDWGYLPLMDRKLLAMDGCNKIPQWEWAKTLEAERSGILNISKAAKAIVPAHTRQIRIYNAIDKETPGYPTKQLSEFLYPIQAYPTVADPTSIARRDIAVFVDSRDVSAEEINRKPTAQPDPEFSLLSEELRWCWSNITQVTFTDDALNYLLSKATELCNTFYYAPIPLVSADMKFKLTRLSIAAAYLTLSTDDYKTVTVTKEHVELIVNFITAEYSKAGLNILAQKHRFEKLTAEDVEVLIEEVEGKLFRSPIDRSKLVEILDDIVTNGRTTKEHLKTNYDLVEKNQLIPLTAVLESVGLIRGGRGYFSTNKLIEAYKVTNNFATLATLAIPQTDTPYNNSPTPEIDTLITEKNGIGDITLEHSKDSKDGKNQQTILPPQLKQPEETLHYQRINPTVEPRTCVNCKAKLAEYKSVLSPEEAKTKGVDAIYACPECFNDAKTNAERDGVKFVEDYPELPPYPEEARNTVNPVKPSAISLDFNTVAYYIPLKKEDTQPSQPCSVCQQTKPLAYSYRTYDGKDNYACIECGDKIRYHVDQRDR